MGRTHTVTYSGREFAGRLHARWAIFFDTLNLRWSYRGRTYQLDTLGRTFTPTFWIDTPEGGYWIEVRPDRSLDAVTVAVANATAEDHDGGSVFMGPPELPHYSGPDTGPIPPVATLRSSGGVQFVHGNHYHGAWAMAFGQPLKKPRRMDLSLWRLECWHENLGDGTCYPWPVPAFEPGPSGKSAHSPRLRAAYSAAKRVPE